ncbi:dihydrolipoyl dehydrogenase [Clostridium bovifaecis]|uniref:Dihydrolipoyl dehydrogenase n=1 Tax=Clostridium bovifaecis TaxID=2184719 RepID=A0A6I6ER37_9CLOT|nr:dihydrolipoyl dehydrogenase [Clostridium bovifaecis]
MKIAVIGGGPGGYEAAIYAAKCGAEVTLIEKEKVGGTCLNRGCIPTKALLASSDKLSTVLGVKKFGIQVNGEVSADFSCIMQRKSKVVQGLVNGVQFLLQSNKVSLINGFGKLKDKNTIEVEKADGNIEEVKADKIILATGSIPVVPEFLKYDGKRVITSDEALELENIPASMIIVGGGVIGCEIGQFLKKMGTEVTIVEMMPHILPSEDPDVAKQLEKQFRKDKIKVHAGDGILEVNVEENSVKVLLQSGKELEAEYLLVSVGRKPYTEGLSLEDMGVERDNRGRVSVNEHLQTKVENIYAIGDIIDTPFLAHVASKEGLIAVDNALGSNKKVSYKAVPRCVYTYPEIAAVGLTEEQLKTKNREYATGIFNFVGLGKAKAAEETEGFVKVIVDKEDKLLGAAIVGSHATDMMQVLTLAIELGLTAETVGDSIFPHPTMSEAIMEALHDVHKKSIHKA